MSHGKVTLSQLHALFFLKINILILLIISSTFNFLYFEIPFIIFRPFLGILRPPLPHFSLIILIHFICELKFFFFFLSNWGLLLPREAASVDGAQLLVAWIYRPLGAFCRFASTDWLFDFWALSSAWGCNFSSGIWLLRLISSLLTMCVFSKISSMDCHLISPFQQFWTFLINSLFS